MSAKSLDGHGGWQLFSTAQWVAWFGATLAASVGTTAFAYNTFLTRTDADTQRGDVLNRLDRIENKLDALIERGAERHTRGVDKDEQD